ncbi:MAG: hypothetical protein WBO29_13640 [Albidovulum sp.]
MSGRWHHLIMGAILSLCVVIGTAWLSESPAWQSLPKDTALIRLSFTQSGVRNCRPRSAEELAALARNMRQKEICERRRAPVYVELDLDGTTVLARNLPPTGLSGSGPSRIYQRFEVPAGDHDIALRLRDDPAMTEFTNTAERRITLAPAESMAIDYSAEAGGFIFH